MFRIGPAVRAGPWSIIIWFITGYNKIITVRTHGVYTSRIIKARECCFFKYQRPLWASYYKSKSDCFSSSTQHSPWGIVELLRQGKQTRFGDWDHKKGSKESLKMDLTATTISRCLQDNLGRESSTRLSVFGFRTFLETCVPTIPWT